jgi:uncharacterized protein
MSPENVQLVRELASIAGSDHASITRFVDDPDLIARFFDPDVEMELSLLPDAEVYRGHDGVRTALQRFLESWAEYEFELEELIDAGDKVVTVYRERGRGRQSGVEVGLRFAQLWTIRAGKIVAYEEYRDVADALAAAGLSE